MSLMAQYLLYCMSDKGERGGVQLFEADSDEEAVQIVSEMKLPVSCEIWERSRFVAHTLPYVERSSSER